MSNKAQSNVHTAVEESLKNQNKKAYREIMFGIGISLVAIGVKLPYAFNLVLGCAAMYNIFVGVSDLNTAETIKGYLNTDKKPQQLKPFLNSKTDELKKKGESCAGYSAFMYLASFASLFFTPAEIGITGIVFSTLMKVRGQSLEYGSQKLSNAILTANEQDLAKLRGVVKNAGQPAPKI